MILDKNLQLSDKQVLTSGAASTNIVDTLAAGDAIAPYGALFHVLINTAVTSSGSASIIFDLQTATDAAFTTPVTLFSSGAIAKASLGLAAVPVNVVIPTGCLQFLRAWYTLSVGTPNAGNCSAYIATAGGFDKTLDKTL